MIWVDWVACVLMGAGLLGLGADHTVSDPGGCLFLCRFSDAGNDDLTTRSGDRCVVHRRQRSLSWGRAQDKPTAANIAKRFSALPSRPGEFHPEPLTDPDLILSHHPARATARRLPPSAEPSGSSWHRQLAQAQRR